MTFKDQLQADLAAMLNTLEFADLHAVELEEIVYNIPAIIQFETTDKYSKPYDGVYQDNIELLFNAADVARAPIRDQQVILDGEIYYVVKCLTEAGLVACTLGVPEV
jgi:hypothetical protein